MTATSETVASPAVRELAITRVFDAPRALVWKAWTQSQHMMHWCAPHGYVVTHCEGSLQVGDSWRSCMRSPQGEDLWVGGVYREIVENEKLAFTHVWEESDQPRHETLVTVTFEDEGSKTRMKFRQEHFRSVASRDGHEGGWSESFERLGEYLQAVQTATDAN